MSFLTHGIFWGYLALWIPFLAFELFYGFRSPWKQSAAGRALMILGGTLNLLLFQTILTQVFGMGWTGRDEVRIVVFVLGFISGWYLLITLLRLQRQGRRDIRNSEETP